MHLNMGFEEDLILRYIIISRDEKIEKKCTLYPLRGREDFSFRTKKDSERINANSILLFPDGETLTSQLAEEIKNQLSSSHNEEGKKELDIVLIDSRWKKTKVILESLPQLRRVSLRGYVTGAKRKEPPPPGGLASVEALYLTSLLLGKPDSTLLDKYHFRERFFEINGIKSL
jgi:ribosome biogenesis protein Tsr3